MTTFFNRVKSKIVKNEKNKDNSLNSLNSNHEPKDNNSGILIVKLVKTKHDKGLGLTVSGGIDRGSNHPVVSHLRLGGIADRSESLVVGDKILAVNNKKTENLTHQEVVDLLRNAGQHVHLKIQYKIPTPDTTINSSCKTAVIQLKKEADGFGIVARESPQTSIHGYRPLVVASVRPGSAAQSRGVIHVGDRLLAINGQALLGLSRDDVVLLLKHAHDQVSLQIEYDVYHKDPINTRNGTWITEVEKPAPSVSLGLILEDRSGVIVISDINEGGVADRLGVFHKDDQIISVNGSYVEELNLARVVDLLAKSGSRVKIEFLTVHAQKQNDEPVLSDRFAKVDSWTCSSPGEFSDDQLSQSTGNEEAAMKERSLRDSDARERLRRALPQAPSSNLTGYDNTSRVLMNDRSNDSSPYEEISEVIGRPRTNVDLRSEPGSDQRSRGKPAEGLYSKICKPRSNSLGASTARNAPWLQSTRGLGSRKSSFSNSESASRGRRQFSSRNNGFWSSGSLKYAANAQLCRQEYVEVNLTADSQGFGLLIAESFVGRQSILVIAGIESRGPAERSGVLQVNDEVLGINDTDVGMMTAEHCNGILQSFGTHVNILVGFTVAESIVATSGTFSVKLPKHYFGLGITFTELSQENDEKLSIIISHVRKGSLAYRTGMLHIGDKLLALNGQNMTCVEDAITLIDAIPLGEIVSVHVQKEQEVEDESSGVVYTIELSKQGRSTLGIVVTGGEETGNHNIFVTSLVPGTVAERSGAVHVGDRILAINDILLKNKPVKEVYQMLDFSGDVVKLRLQSVDSRRTKTPKDDQAPVRLEIPDMSSLHRVSAWAEIFNELDQIVASTPSDGKKGSGEKTEVTVDDGSEISLTVPDIKTGNELTESEMTATKCNEVKSGNDEFWEQLDELCKGENGKTGQCAADVAHTSEVCSHAAPTRTESTDKCLSTDSSSGTLKGKSISIRYVVHEKCVNPTQETRERTTQRSCVYFTQDTRGNITRDDSKKESDETSTLCGSSTNDSRGYSLSGFLGTSRNESRETPTTNETHTNETRVKLTQAKSLERSSSVASGYETDNSILRSSANDLPHCGRSSRADTEPFASMDSFDISNDADDKLPSFPSARKGDTTQDVLETRSFSVQKSEELGFGFSLMPDKFKQEVYIASVLPGGPCDGMLQPLDKITKIDDKDLTQLNIHEIIEILQHGPPTIKLCVVRNPFNTYIHCKS